MHAASWEQVELPMPRTAVWQQQLHQSFEKSYICYESAATQSCTQLRVASYTKQALLQGGAFLANHAFCLFTVMPRSKRFPCCIICICRSALSHPQGLPGEPACPLWPGPPLPLSRAPRTLPPDSPSWPGMLYAEASAVTYTEIMLSTHWQLDSRESVRFGAALRMCC
jgi:hypothetical protein